MDQTRIEQKARTLLKDVITGFGEIDQSASAAQGKWTNELNNLSPSDRLAVALEMKKQRNQLDQKYPGLLPPLYIETAKVDGVEQLTNIRKDENTADDEMTESNDLYDRPGQVIRHESRDERSFVNPPTDEQLAERALEQQKRCDSLWREREEVLTRAGTPPEQARQIICQERKLEEAMTKHLFPEEIDPRELVAKTRH